MSDTRPKVYRYWDQLIEHIGSPDVIFNGEFVWPRQFEIHLPSNHLQACNLNCAHCAGGRFDKSLGTWEITGLRLLDRLEGKIPFHIYGGAYTEPILNPYYMAFLAMTKRHGNHFGIHTNATTLLTLEKCQGWLHELNRISTDDADYLSVALDGGLPWGWQKTKRAKRWETFWTIIEALRRAVTIREKAGKGHAIRVTFLLDKYNDSPQSIGAIVNILQDIQVDSLRFAIPFAQYNQTFDKVRKYKRETETPGDALYRERLAPYLSEQQDARPYIFYTGPEFTDIDKFDFTKCVYGYYQITYGADGYCYRCSTSATPTMAYCRLGPITDNVEELEAMIRRNQGPGFNAQVCFEHGARCNRMGLEICREYADIEKGRKPCAS